MHKIYRRRSVIYKFMYFL